jgi:hypothetical protein
MESGHSLSRWEGPVQRRSMERPIKVAVKLRPVQPIEVVGVRQPQEPSAHGLHGTERKGLLSSHGKLLTAAARWNDGDLSPFAAELLFDERGNSRWATDASFDFPSRFEIKLDEATGGYIFFIVSPLLMDRLVKTRLHGDSLEMRRMSAIGRKRVASGKRSVCAASGLHHRGGGQYFVLRQSCPFAP